MNVNSIFPYGIYLSIFLLKHIILSRTGYILIVFIWTLLDALGFNDLCRWPELTTLPGEKLDAQSAPVGQKPRRASISLDAHKHDVPVTQMFYSMEMKISIRI